MKLIKRMIWLLIFLSLATIIFAAPYNVSNCGTGVEGLYNGSPDTWCGYDFNLTQSITCSGAKTPLCIGTDLSGNVYGNDYTIHSLNISCGVTWCGLFEQGTGGPNFYNLGLTNLTVHQPNAVTLTGGLMGLSPGEIHNCYAVGTITSVGGLVGGLVGGRATLINNSNFTGVVSSPSNAGVGGLIGDAETVSCNIVNSFFRGNVTGKSLVGGLAGHLAGNISNSYVINSKIKGTMPATFPVRTGGLTGRLGSGGIYNSYFVGNISVVRENVGGLVGEVVGGLQINNSFFMGNITGALSPSGAIVGESGGENFNLYNVYWNNHSENPDLAFGNGSMDGVTAINDDIDYFKNFYNPPYTSWDLAGTWAINPLVNDGWPYISLSNSAPAYNTSQVEIANFCMIEDGNNNTVNLSKAFYDPDDDPLYFSYILNDSNNFGVSVNNFTGIITVTSITGNWSGDGLINLTATDGTVWTANTTQFNISVSAVNDPPHYNHSQNHIGDINLTVIGYNDSIYLKYIFNDTEGDALTAFEYGLNDTTCFVVIINNATGRVNVSFDSSCIGTGLINFSAFDGTDWSTQNSTNFVININNAPPEYNTSQVEMRAITMVEDHANDTINLSKVFFDPQNTPMNYTNFINDTANFDVHVNNDTGMMNISVATANWSGTAYINFSAFDGVLWASVNSSNFNITVTAVNDAPDINNTNVSGLTSSTNLTQYFNYSIWANLSDIEGDSIDRVNFTVLWPNGTAIFNNTNGTNVSTIWNSSSFNVSVGGLYQVMINTSDGVDTTNIAWNFSVVVNNLLITEWEVSDMNLGAFVDIMANVTIDAPLVWCNYSFNYPNGSTMIDNSVGNNSVKEHNYEEFVHSIELQGNGTYRGNVTCESDNGYRDTYNFINFKVNDDWLLSPTTFFDALQLPGDEITFNLSFRPSSLTSFNYVINVSTYPWNDTAYNISINNTLNSTTYNLTNSSIWQIPVTINTTAGLKNGTYTINLAMNRVNESYERTELVYITVGAHPPAGNLVILNDSENLCSGTYCDGTTYLISGVPFKKIWYLNNTGGYNLSDCVASVDNDLTGITYSFSDRNFSLQNESTTLKEFEFSIGSAPLGYYQGYVNITCTANSYGDLDSLTPDQRPFISFYSAGLTTAGGGGGGGGPDTVIEYITELIPVGDLLDFIVGDGLCEFEKGEDLVTSPQDCRINFDLLLSGALFKQQWFVRVLILLVVTGGLIVFVAGNPKFEKKFKSWWKKK